MRYQPAPLPCRYCGKPVEPDFDVETNSYSSPNMHLFECWHARAPEGEGFVVDWNGRDEEHHAYKTEQRALDQAEALAGYNTVKCVFAVIDVKNRRLVKVIRGQCRVPDLKF